MPLHDLKQNSPLFPPDEDRLRCDDFLTRALAQASERVIRGSVAPTFTLANFKDELSRFSFAVPCPLNEVLVWTIASMEKGLVHINHPRYFGLFNPAPSFPAQCADRIAGAFNPQLATATTSPAAVEIEAHVIRAIAQRTGLPSHSIGHFTCGGSEANFTGLICALTRADSLFRTDGARAFKGQPVFYVSRESHLGWIKIAHEAGIGRNAARLIDTDGSGRMCQSALAEAIHRDQRDGCVPFMIAATAGTTNAGMVDPLEACAKLAQTFGLWFHVDAAWGGALVVSDRLREVLTGIERADSVTIDAHKWFATTMGCGMFITSDPLTLTSAFDVTTDFMPSQVAGWDPYLTSMQWSRRFLGIRLFLSLAAAGWSGYARHVERSVELVESLKNELAAEGWTIANDSALALLCIKPPPGTATVKTIVSKILASGKAWVAATKFEGSDVIRICVTHGESSDYDIHQLVVALKEAAASSDEGTSHTVN